MKLLTLTTRLVQLNNILLFFPPDCVVQMVTVLPGNEAKEILYHAIPNLWRKKMIKQGHKYLDDTIQKI